MKLVVAIIKPFKLDDVKAARAGLRCARPDDHRSAGLRSSARSHRGVPRRGVHDRLRAEGEDRDSWWTTVRRRPSPSASWKRPAPARSATARCGSFPSTRSSGFARAKPALTRSSIAITIGWRSEERWSRLHCAKRDNAARRHDIAGRGVRSRPRRSRRRHAAGAERVARARRRGWSLGRRARFLRTAGAVSGLRRRRVALAQRARPQGPRVRARDLRAALVSRCGTPGFVTGHGTRTVKESIALADDDLDALTAILEVRHVAGDASVTDELMRQGRALGAQAPRAHAARARRRVRAAAAAPRARRGDARTRSQGRRRRPARRAVARVGGVGVRPRRGSGAGGEPRATGGCRRARCARIPDRRRRGASAGRKRDVAHAAGRVAAGHRFAFRSPRAAGAGRGRRCTRHRRRRCRSCATSRPGRGRSRGSPGDVLGARPRRDRRVVSAIDNARPIRLRRASRCAMAALHARRRPTDRSRRCALLEAAVAAAELDVPFERSSLVRLRAMQTPTWDVWERAAFLRLLRAGARAVPVFEALDHEGVLVQLLPEWEHVRSRPATQRVPPLHRRPSSARSGRRVCAVARRRATRRTTATTSREPRRVRRSCVPAARAPAAGRVAARHRQGPAR